MINFSFNYKNIISVYKIDDEYSRNWAQVQEDICVWASFPDVSVLMWRNCVEYRLILVGSTWISSISCLNWIKQRIYNCAKIFIGWNSRRLLGPIWKVTKLPRSSVSMNGYGNATGNHPHRFGIFRCRDGDWNIYNYLFYLFRGFWWKLKLIF